MGSPIGEKIIDIVPFSFTQSEAERAVLQNIKLEKLVVEEMPSITKLPKLLGENDQEERGPVVLKRIVLEPASEALTRAYEARLANDKARNEVFKRPMTRIQVCEALAVGVLFWGACAAVAIFNRIYG